LPPQVRIVDSAATTAATALLELWGSTHPNQTFGDSRGSVTFLASDGAERFARVGSGFLGEALRADAVEIVDLIAI
jgi:glutamate racemase